MGRYSQDVALNPEGCVSLGEVTVVTEADQASEAALLVERKTAPTVSDSIGAQEMSRMVGSDASDVMQRVTGVSIVDSKYVYIRGLGERYSTTMLNGAVVPSTRPDKKVVPMDLVPAALLQNIRTEKSYTPDQPGEFSGGLVKMNTVDFPRSPILKLSYGTGFGSTTTFKDFADYPGRQPGLARIRRRDPRAAERDSQPETDASWTPSPIRVLRRPSCRATGSPSATSGRLAVVGTRFPTRVSTSWPATPSASWVWSWPFPTATNRTGSRKAGTITVRRVRGSSPPCGNTRWTSAPAPSSPASPAISRTSSPTTTGSSSRTSSARTPATSPVSSRVTTRTGNSFLTWRLSYSLSSLDEPDLREALYEERNDRFLLADESQSGFRLFNDLDENIWEPGLDWTTYFNHGSVNSSIKVGASYRSRQRDFLSRRFRFAPLRTAGIDLTQTPERIFTPRNIHPSGFELREETRPTDTYDAKQLTRAGYAMLDLSIDNWRFIGGGRVEADSQRVETFDLFDRTSPTGVSTRLDNTDLLPAFSVVYRLDNDMNLRGGYGRTLNRPEFRELSPFEFTDVVEAGPLSATRNWSGPGSRTGTFGGNGS